MYHSCIFCSGDLGANFTVESFPVGLRIAFDSAKGRLWVVCPTCARWNLAPIEDRWGPIEEAEAAFRRSRLRVQRENIGLTQLPDGTDLVRVGDALPGELAAWRYGTEFLRRRNRYVVGAAVAGVVVVGLATLPIVGVLGGGGIASWGFAKGVWLWSRRKLVHRIARGVDRNEPIDVRRWHVEGMSVGINERAELELLVRDPHVEIPSLFSVDSWLSPFVPMWGAKVTPHTGDVVTVTGREAYGVLRRSMVHVNGTGASHAKVRSAVSLLAGSGAADAFLLRTARSGFDLGPRARDAPQRLPKPAALALEMALNDSTEREAVEGELTELRRAWREAEEIAEIADSLPDSIQIPGWMRP